MSLASRVQSLLVDVNGPGNPVRSAWNRLENVPGGKRLFSRIVGQAAPYTGTMAAEVCELRPGYAKVMLRDRRRVRNHLGSVHAVALVNLAELTANVALIFSLPDDARFIVSGLSIEYLKKARGTIIGESHCPVPVTSEKKTYEIPVVMRNAQGDEVARATLVSLVGPKKR